MVGEPREHATLAEYLALDARSDVKHELVTGTIVDMAGGTPAHSDLATNATGLLFGALLGKPCRVNDSDLRIGRVDDEFRAYPDVVVEVNAPVVGPTGGLATMTGASRLRRRGDRRSTSQASST
jgi:Uma2 family endonuclease